jgi:hypothetical protein
MDETGYTVHCHAIHFADNSTFPCILFYLAKRSVPVVGEHRAPSKSSSTGGREDGGGPGFAAPAAEENRAGAATGAAATGAARGGARPIQPT